MRRLSFALATERERRSAALSTHAGQVVHAVHAAVGAAEPVHSLCRLAAERVAEDGGDADGEIMADDAEARLCRKPQPAD